MRALAIITNFFIPGLGTLIVGKVGQGIAQLLLFIVGFWLAFAWLILPIGLPICFAVWIWGLVVATRTPIQSVQSPAPRTGESSAG